MGQRRRWPEWPGGARWDGFFSRLRERGHDQAHPEVRAALKLEHGEVRAPLHDGEQQMAAAAAGRGRSRRPRKRADRAGERRRWRIFLSRALVRPRCFLFAGRDQRDSTLRLNVSRRGQSTSPSSLPHSHALRLEYTARCRRHLEARARRRRGPRLRRRQRRGGTPMRPVARFWSWA